jgi:hypothetical protein
MAARNKCLARNNKSGPVQSDARLGTSDEPVQALARRTGEQGSDRARHRPLNGHFRDEAKPCSEVASLLDGSVGTIPTMPSLAWAKRGVPSWHHPSSPMQTLCCLRAGAPTSSVNVATSEAPLNRNRLFCDGHHIGRSHGRASSLLLVGRRLRNGTGIDRY